MTITQRSAHVLTATVLLLFGAIAAEPAELQPRTVAAFDRYVQLTEKGAAAAAAFLRLDSLPEPEQRARRAELQAGGLIIERLTTRDGHKEIPIPDGIMHHWLGTVFVPGVTVQQTVALLQDYNRHADIYHPAVVQSKLLARDGNLFRMYLRFSMTRIITVVVNTEHEARFSHDRADRAQSRIYSTRIAQVEDAGTPGERELPVGLDGGYLWRLNTYWRFLERDGGTYVECESLTLTRDIPFGVGWIIRPFVTSIPRDSLEFTLNSTRNALARVETP